MGLKSVSSTTIAKNAGNILNILFMTEYKKCTFLVVLNQFLWQTSSIAPRVEQKTIPAAFALDPK